MAHERDEREQAGPGRVGAGQAGTGQEGAERIDAAQIGAEQIGAGHADVPESAEPHRAVVVDAITVQDDPQRADAHVAPDATGGSADTPFAEHLANGPFAGDHAPGPDAPASVPPVAQEPAPAPRPAEPRDLGLGQKTAEGLATMTPVARQTEAGHRFLGDVALRVEHLTKRYGSIKAVDDVSYEIRQGSFSGIVGPNGAGKTTTLMMMAGLLKPSSGEVHVGDTNVWTEPRAAHRRIGILPDRLRMFDQLTGAQYLGYVGTLRGLGRDELAARIESLLDVFELRGSANRLVVDYSAGLRKKLALAATLIHSPEVLILDEPFETIDPVSAGVLIDVLIDYADRGGTVVLSSHSMDLVQRVCDHVAVIVKGEVIAEGTVEEVRGDITLEERFRHIVRGPAQEPGLDWLEISFG